MFTIVKVVEVTALGGYRLRVVFSDGSVGEHDSGRLIEEGGPMVERLCDPAFFSRVFVEMGVLAWPNGFDIDAIKLHTDMEAAGELHRDAAE
jgi:hypothetical protein